MLRNWFGPPAKRRPSPARTPRLGCEQLGDRIVPSVASLIINEVAVNPPGPGDTGREYVELRRTGGGTDLTDLKLVMVEGENGGTQSNSAGRADFVVDLAALGTGYNGEDFIVIVDDDYDGPEPTGAFFIKVDGFNIENGSVSAVLTSKNGTINQNEDYDDDNGGAGDGVLDADFGTVIDAVGFKERSGDFVYGFDVTPTSTTADPDLFYRDLSYTTSFSSYTSGGYDSNAWYAGELSGTDGSNPDWGVSLTFGSGTTAPSTTSVGDDNV